MKSVSGGLAAHIAGEVTTLATIWRVTRADGQVFGYTDHDADVVYGALTHIASAGYTASAVETRAGLAADNLEITGLLDAPSITEADLMAGKWDFAKVEISLINWADTSQGILRQRVGRLGEVRVARGRFIAELLGLAVALQQSVGRVVQVACDARLGDARCKVNLATYTVSGAVTAVSSRRAFTDAARAEAQHWFRYGRVIWTSGANNGYAMEVDSFASGAFGLALPMPYDIAISDTYSAYAGCDKSGRLGAAHCKAKFSNYVNFQGFEDVPGMDKMLRPGGV